MKTSTRIAFMLINVLCLNGQAPPPPLPREPARIARWIVEDVWNNGDFSLAALMFSPGAILHYRGHDIPLTPESGVRIVKNWRAGFPDFHFKIEDMIVADDKVVLRIPFTGTHLGKFWGLEPTGRKIKVTETLIIRIADDRIAEMWEDYDEYGMRLQLGLLKSN
jgi:hypothetical protein